MTESFGIETPLWEIVARGTVVYLLIAFVLRVVPKRQIGSISPNDLIFLVMMGSLAADAISGDAKTVMDLLLMVLVIVLWDYLFNLAEYYIPRFRRIAQDSPTLLVHRGELLHENLRKEKITEEEVAALLRKQGVFDMGRVEQAILEVDGHISVIEREAGA